MISRSLICLVLAAGSASAALAGQIQVSNIGGGVVLNSGPIGLAFPGPASLWTTSSVAAIHASLNASGISTEGKVTFLAADTSQGLAFMTLFDRQLVEGASVMGNLHMDSVANGTSLAYLKDTAGNITIGANGPNARIASGDFAWNSNGGGDAFAWAGLDNGNSATFRFNTLAGMNLGLDASSPFQFVTWTGSVWAVVSVPGGLLSFSATDDFGFAITAVPTPGVLAAMAAPMFGLSMIRRRRAR